MLLASFHVIVNDIGDCLLQILRNPSPEPLALIPRLDLGCLRPFRHAIVMFFCKPLVTEHAGSNTGSLAATLVKSFPNLHEIRLSLEHRDFSSKLHTDTVVDGMVCKRQLGLYRPHMDFARLGDLQEHPFLKPPSRLIHQLGMDKMCRTVQLKRLTVDLNVTCIHEMDLPVVRLLWEKMKELLASAMGNPHGIVDGVQTRLM